MAALRARQQARNAGVTIGLPARQNLAMTFGLNQGEGSTSGAFGLMSSDGTVSSTRDLRWAAFSTRTAASRGLLVS